MPLTTSIGPTIRRAPNPYSPEEVRRAIQAAQTTVSGHTDDLTSIDGRVTILESIDSEYSAVADVNVAIGKLVYVKNTGHLGLAKSDSASTFKVAGIVVVAALSTFVASYISDGKLSISNWTSIAGTATLTPGAIYYLSDATAGMITISPPSTLGHYVAPIGRATSTLILDIEIEPTILL